MSKSKPIRILYMEDDSSLAYLLKKKLERLGIFIVAIAKNGEEGLAKLTENNFDIVLVDYNMPCHSGLEVASIINSRKSAPPIIMVTGYGDEKVAVDAMKLGVADYIVKDANMEYIELLPTVIKQVLHHRQLEEEKKRVEVALKARQKEIEELNTSLETRIEEELERSRRKDLLMTQQARQAAMGQMIGNIAHQWRQPLNALSIFISNIKYICDSKKIKEKELDEFITRSIQLIMEMSITVQNFMNFFVPSGKKKEFCVNEIIQYSLSLIDATFKFHFISVVVNEKEILKTIGIPNEYSQVILNILDNAKDAIVSKGIEGEIRIDVYHENNFGVVKITNNGGIIPENILTKLFTPYVTTKKEGNGCGIGVYLSKLIIEDHMEGSIEVKNTDDGVEFKIITPLSG
jgi:C4-dicarboxylate-specific signal transduction histidine kinase